MRALGPGSVSSFLKVILDVFHFVLWIALGGAAIAIVAVLATIYSVWAIVGAGLETAVWGATLLLLGAPVYLLSRKGAAA